MPGISIHVVDVSRGVVASGLRVELARCAPTAAGGAAPEQIIADGRIGGSGLLEAPALAATFEAGYYEARFHVGEYYRSAGVALPGVPFLDVAAYRFGIDSPAQHYHLPFKMTPWGYSCFRGGA